jgi:hypothetical protein
VVVLFAFACIDMGVQAFKLLDQENKGYISHKDLYQLLATTEFDDANSQQKSSSFMENFRHRSSLGDIHIPSMMSFQIEDTSTQTGVEDSSGETEEMKEKNRLKRLQTKVIQYITVIYMKFIVILMSCRFRKSLRRLTKTVMARSAMQNSYCV